MSESKLILERLQHALGVSSQTALANALNINKSTVANWFKRNSTPFEEVVAAAKSSDISLDWLLLGRGDRHEHKKVRALEQQVEVLKGELERLAGKVGVPESDHSLDVVVPGELKYFATDGVEFPPETGKISNLLKIIDYIMRNGRGTEGELQAQLNVSMTELQQYCAYLYRHRVLKRSADAWILTRDAVLRVASDEDVATVARAALQFLWERVVPGTRASESRGIIVIAEIRVAGDEPGEKLMRVIRNALATVDDDAGKPQKIVVGVAPE